MITVDLHQGNDGVLFCCCSDENCNGEYEWSPDTSNTGDDDDDEVSSDTTDDEGLVITVLLTVGVVTMILLSALLIYIVHVLRRRKQQQLKHIENINKHQIIVSFLEKQKLLQQSNNFDVNV